MNKLISCIFLFCLWMPSAISQTDRSVDLLYGEWFLKQDHKSKESDSLLFIRNNPANLDKLGGMDVSYELSWTFHENLTVSESEVFANALQYHRTYNWTLNEGDSVLLVSKSKKYFIERLTGDTLCLINMKPQSFTNSELESFLLESDLKVCSWIDSIYDLQVIKLTNDSEHCKSEKSDWGFSIDKGNRFLTVVNSSGSSGSIISDGTYRKYHWKLKDENVLSVFNTGTTTDFKVALNQDCVYLVQNENSNITIPSHLRHEWFTCNDARTEEVGSIISLRKSKSELNCHSRWMWSFKKDLEFGLSSEGSVLSGSYVGLKWGYSIEEGRPIVRIIDSDEIPVLFEVITLSEDEMTLRKID